MAHNGSSSAHNDPPPTLNASQYTLEDSQWLPKAFQLCLTSTPNGRMKIAMYVLILDGTMKQLEKYKNNVIT